MNVVQTIQDLLLRMGTGWVLWLLLGLLLLSLIVALERWLLYRQVDVDLRATAQLLDERLGRGEVAAAIAELGRSRAVAARIASAGLRLAPRGPEAVDKAMQSAAGLERGRLERRLAVLGTVGSNAPFVGLFGTVIGVIHAFNALGRATHAAASAAQPATGAVMSSLADALVATAVGILVAIPSIALYNFLQRRVSGLIAASDVLSNLVLAYLVERRALRAPKDAA